MAIKTATRFTEGKSGEPGQKIVTVNKNDTSTGAKNQVVSDDCLMAKGGGDD
jgi:hypothetical protein